MAETHRAADAIRAALTDLGLSVEDRLAGLGSAQDSVRNVIEERLAGLGRTQESALAAQSAEGSRSKAEIVALLRDLRRDIAAQTSFSTNDILLQVAVLAAEIDGVREDLVLIDDRLSSIAFERSDAGAHDGNGVAPLDAPLRRSGRPALAPLVTDLHGTLLEALHGRRSDAERAAALNAQLNLLEQWMQKISVETSNRLIHVDTSLHSRLNTLENDLLPQLSKQIHQIAAMQMMEAAERADRSEWRPHCGESYRPATPEPFEAILARAERDFPKVYGAWHERLLTMRAAFDVTKVGNAAHASDLYSRMFRSFVEMHACGRVLDVGCGPFGRPYYLTDYPAEMISGLDPLRHLDRPDFEAVQGISEYLPWPDGSFSTVISATSLDHCLSLDRSLAEMRRVLRPGGSILLWVGSKPGAPPFRPEEAGYVPADKFHLFHFDVAWFEPMLAEAFDVCYHAEMERVGYSHVFYVLKLKSPQATSP